MRAFSDWRSRSDARSGGEPSGAEAGWPRDRATRFGTRQATFPGPVERRSTPIPSLPWPFPTRPAFDDGDAPDRRLAVASESGPRWWGNTGGSGDVSNRAKPERPPGQGGHNFHFPGRKKFFALARRLSNRMTRLLPAHRGVLTHNPFNSTATTKGADICRGCCR